MKRSYLLLVTLLLFSSTAYSQQSKNASYSCIVEWMGGGWYNSSTKRWEGNAFKPNSLGEYAKFVLTIQYIETRPVLTFKKTEQLDDYRMFITPSGSPFPRCSVGQPMTDAVEKVLD
jgi:hypothetical protein